MRRPLLVIVGAVILVDTMFYAALAPLLPGLRDTFAMTKGDAGVLVGAYALGTVLGAIPGGWAAARFGARSAVLAGLALMGSAGLAFAFAGSLAALDGARFIQGLGGACSWTAGLAWIAQETDRDRRGEALGIAIGAGIFGAQFGPVLGSIATQIGREAAFAGAAALGIVLAAVVLGTPPGAGALAEAGTRPAAILRDRRFRVALWLTVLPSVCFGVVEVLAPLRLDVLGATALAIGLIFFVAAFFEALVSPVVGRIADRRGVLTIVRVGTLCAAAALLLLALPRTVVGLALVLTATGVALGTLWVPAGSEVSHRADALDVDQGWAFAFNNVCWAGAVTVGSAGGGALAEVVGDWLPYAIAAALCLATGVAALALRPGRSLGSSA
jgi:MFS family permease